MKKKPKRKQLDLSELNAETLILDIDQSAVDLGLCEAPPKTSEKKRVFRKKAVYFSQ